MKPKPSWCLACVFAAFLGVAAVLPGCGVRSRLNTHEAWVATVAVREDMSTRPEPLKVSPLPSARTTVLGDFSVRVPEGWQVGEVRREVDDATSALSGFSVPIHSVPGIGDCHLTLEYVPDATWPVEPEAWRKAVGKFCHDATSFFAGYTSDLELFAAIHNQMPGVLVYVRSNDQAGEIMARLALKRDLCLPAKRLDGQSIHAFAAATPHVLVAEVFDTDGRFRGLAYLRSRTYAQEKLDLATEESRKASIGAVLAPAAERLLGPRLATRRLTRHLAWALGEHVFLQILANARFAPPPDGKKRGFRFVPPAKR